MSEKNEKSNNGGVLAICLIALLAFLAFLIFMWWRPVNNCCCQQPVRQATTTIFGQGDTNIPAGTYKPTHYAAPLAGIGVEMPRMDYLPLALDPVVASSVGSVTPERYTWSPSLTAFPETFDNNTSITVPEPQTLGMMMLGLLVVSGLVHFSTLEK